MAARIRAACLTFIALCLPLSTRAEALLVVDQNPFLSGFAPDGFAPARLPQPESWTFETAFSWGSSALVQSSAVESLVADAETRELQFIAERRIGESFALRFHLPYRHTSAGTLDSFIDSWHDTFGLPGGVRDSLPQDALQLFYRREGSVYLDADSTQQGLGDASVTLGRSLANSERTALTAWLGLKLPTGDAQNLTGSGSVDVSLSLAAEHRLSDRWLVYAGLAGRRLGRGDFLPQQQRDWLASARAGLSVRAIGNLTLILQVDAHTAAFESDLDFLGDAVMLSVGGSFRLPSNWELSLGVTEDIDVETTSDVVFLFGLKTRL